MKGINMAPMDAITQAKLLGELKYEIDMLYVATEMALSLKYKERPFDSMIFEVVLLHFRVVWDFFYGGEASDFVVRDILTTDQLKSYRPKQHQRLREIRRYVNVMLAHLSKERVDSDVKEKLPDADDFRLIRRHTEDLFKGFVAALNPNQKAAFHNPLAHKFTNFQVCTLRPISD
jgi:hypothetical protein